MWRGGRVLATLPVLEGRTVFLPGQDIPARLDATVSDPAGVVDADGQDVLVWTTLREGVREARFPNGRFLVYSTERPADGTSRLIGRGTLQRVKDHGATSPRRGAGTIPGTITQILARDGLTLVSPGLPQTPLPAGWMLGTDPWDDLTVLAAAWGAILIETPTGEVEARPLPRPITAPPPVSWRSGEGGTLVSRRSDSARERTPNHWIVEGADGLVVEDYVTTGRLSVSTYGWVTTRISTDLPTLGELRRAARLHVEAATTVTSWWDVEVQPDWRLEPGDPVEVARGNETVWGHLIAYDRPLTPAGGPAREQIGVPS